MLMPIWAFAAYFPDLSISGQYGFQASTLQKLISATANSWSYGATLTQTIFDAGAISAKVRGARASYDSAVANYRQTVLTAFQGVEDNIAAMRVLESEYAIDQAASASSASREDATSRSYSACRTRKAAILSSTPEKAVRTVWR